MVVRATSAAALVVAALALPAVGATRVAQIAPMPTQTPTSSFMPLATPAPQLGPAISVDDVLAQSLEYDNKPVQATGIARNVRVDETGAGPVLQFDLCGHRCILVLDAHDPAIADDSTATVSGTFYRHLRRGRFAQDDILLSMNGTLRGHSFDWRRQLEGYPPTPMP